MSNKEDKNPIQELLDYYQRKIDSIMNILGNESLTYVEKSRLEKFNDLNQLMTNRMAEYNAIGNQLKDCYNRLLDKEGYIKEIEKKCELLNENNIELEKDLEIKKTELHRLKYGVHKDSIDNLTKVLNSKNNYIEHLHSILDSPLGSNKRVEYIKERISFLKDQIKNETSKMNELLSNPKKQSNVFNIGVADREEIRFSTAMVDLYINTVNTLEHELTGFNTLEYELTIDEFNSVVNGGGSITENEKL